MPPLTDTPTALDVETAGLFDGTADNALDAALIGRLRAAYERRLLDNPPTPAFMETNPKREAAARYAARRDVQRFLAVLGDLGLVIRHGGP